VKAPIDISEQLAGHSHVILCGGPRTGKSTLAVRLSERHSIPVKFGDSLVGTHEWSEASLEVSNWIDDPEPWIIDGVVAVRALRKWLPRNPDAKPDFVVVYMRDNIQVQTDKQKAMAKAIHTIWKEVEPELVRRGIKVIHRDT
jgi:adenylate kinase family enzyme